MEAGQIRASCAAGFYEMAFGLNDKRISFSTKLC
jgi:hypothetical protein